MRMVDIIEKKRDGQALTLKEIEFFINGYVSGGIPDYQIAALLMAIFFRGMNFDETVYLTQSMLNSGDKVDLSSIEGVKVDKHSTGGVGDKTTLIVAPIVASCGVPVAKMSGKGLGYTGGTIDKLDSITGFKTALTMKQFLSNVRDIGISISGQTGNLVPADKKLYALRDVTATVNQLSLIASSIMSKKIASGSDAIVLDVKVGSGAFMKTEEEARKLAKTMVKIGKYFNRRTVALITNMNIPLGNAIGNSLEVIEAIEVLKGNGPKDLIEICSVLAAKMLVLAGKGNDNYCKGLVAESIETGRALKKFIQMVERQGGTSRIIDNYNLFPKAALQYRVVSKKAGYISRIYSDILGIFSMMLGAGRTVKEDKIDYGAGIYLLKKVGDEVLEGEDLCILYSNDEKKLNSVLNKVNNAFEFSNQKYVEQPLIIDIID